MISFLFLHCEKEDLRPCVCEGSSSYTGHPNFNANVFVPNAFTPNDDNHNELFKPVTSFISDEEYSFTIYNIKAEEIFTTNDPQSGWDGEGYHQGTYHYTINVKDTLGRKININGIINLLLPNATYPPLDQPLNYVFKDFPEGIEYCRFGDMIDPTYGFIYNTQEDILNW